ncbi:MAG: hypothetical protein RIQ47_1603 [Bacteroidota bacterium]|jgi:predicted DNA-binding transcriptional regulator YafY
MKAKRILLIEQFLKMGPETIDSLHLKLESSGIKCSHRSIYRDLDLIGEYFKDPYLEFIVMDAEFNKKKWLITRRKTASSDDFDLFISSYIVDQFTPGWLKQVSGGLMKTLMRYGYQIPNDVSKKIITNIPPHSVVHSGWSEFIHRKEIFQFIKDALWAIANDKLLEISHFIHQKKHHYYFKTFRLVYHRGTVHLAGWVIDIETSQAEFAIRELDAFESLTVSNERCKTRTNTRSANAALQSRFGIHDASDVKLHSIKIEMGEGPYLFLSKRIWHHTQKFYKGRAGKYYLEFQSEINIELVGWIFSWMEHVKVIRPTSLKRLMSERAKYILGMYQDDLNPVDPTDTNNPFIIGK